MAGSKVFNHRPSTSRIAICYYSRTDFSLAATEIRCFELKKFGSPVAGPVELRTSRVRKHKFVKLAQFYFVSVNRMQLKLVDSGFS